MSTHSKACCSLPPVVSENYEPKGKYIELDGLKTYVTGPDNADTAILVFFDIFGFFPQTLQGADILAYVDKDRPKQVFIPDFWEGKPANIEWFPTDTKEKEQALGAWFSVASPPKHLPKVPGLLDAAEKVNPNIKTWGTIGYCWGGKIVALVGAQENGRFKAGVQTSPALVDIEDADKIKIPTLLLPSKDESRELFEQYRDKLKVPNHLEYFGNQIHGWMSARGDLKDPEVKKDYERGYQLAADFFSKHL